MTRTAALLVGTAPVDRVRALLPRVRAVAEAVTLLVPETRAGAFADRADDVDAVVGFSGDLAPGPAWDRIRPAIAATRPTIVYVAMNRSGFDAYRDVAAALATIDIPPSRVVFVAAESPQLEGLSLAAWRRATRSARWRARARCLRQHAWIREAAAVVALTAALAGVFAATRWAAFASSLLLACSAHALAWRYARATTGEYSGDAAIHFQFARRFARGEWFCYNPGQFAAGSSSPLWTALLGVSARMMGEARLEASTARLSWASLHVALLLSAAGAAMLLGLDHLWGLAPLAIAAGAPVFVWTARSMEAPLALAASAAVVLAVVADSPAAVAASVAVASLLRWELAATLVPVLAWASIRSGSLWPLVALGPVALLSLDVRRRTGSWLPASGRARRRYAALRNGGWRQDWSLVWRRPDLWLLAAIGMIAAPGWTAGAWAVGGWLAALLGFFLVVVPGTYDGRYLIPALAAMAVLAAAGADVLLSGARGSAGWLAGAGLAAWSIVRWWRTSVADLPAAEAAAQDAAVIERRFRRTVAEGLAATLPAGATLGLVEVDLLWPIGRDDVRVLSLDGVLDPSMLEALQSGALLPALAARGATHVLVESCLYARPGWTTVDLVALTGEADVVSLPGGGRATFVTSWPYRNWGDRSVVWPWRLWRLEWPATEAACCR